MRNGSSITTGKKAMIEPATGAILVNIFENRNRLAGRNKSATEIEAPVRNGPRIGTGSREREVTNLREIDLQLFNQSRWPWMLPSCPML